jgi:DNA-binding MarR family transcriptional regulator
MTVELHVFDRLLQIALLIQEDMASSFAGTGLTTARTHLLWELHQLGPSTQQTLAAVLKVSPRNVTGLVDALEAGGFVKRRPHPTDRRALLVTLTELGGRTMTDMVADRQEVAGQLVADFDEDELEQFGRCLDLVADRLKELVEAAERSAAPGPT